MSQPLKEEWVLEVRETYLYLNETTFYVCDVVKNKQSWLGQPLRFKQTCEFSFPDTAEELKEVEFMRCHPRDPGRPHFFSPEDYAIFMTQVDDVEARSFESRLKPGVRVRPKGNIIGPVTAPPSPEELEKFKSQIEREVVSWMFGDLETSENNGQVHQSPTPEKRPRQSVIND